MDVVKAVIPSLISAYL